MWISKKEYNGLKTTAEFWEKEYYKMSERKNDTLKAIGDCLKATDMTIKDLKDEVESLKHTQKELQEYKQKYADEVQKRLELVKLLENTPLTN